MGTLLTDGPPPTDHGRASINDRPLTDDKHLIPAAKLRPATFIDLIRHRAETQGTRPVLTYLANGEEESATQTYADLDRQARAVAVVLGDNCRVGDRALLFYLPSEIEFVKAFMGCLYAGVVAIPVPPPLAARVIKDEGPDSDARRERVQKMLAKVLAIIADARPTIIMTTRSLHAALERFGTEYAAMRLPRWVITDNFGDKGSDRWTRPQLDESSLAFLQYTSGSTAAPKGVMVTHGGLLDNARLVEYTFNQSHDDMLVSWLPTFHDLGLIYGVLQPVYGGFRCYLMPPPAFIQRPLRWLRAMSRYGGTHAAAPNFAYDLCVRKATEEDRAQLDLSRWRVAINGAEPVRKETLERFAAAFAVSGFRRSTLRPAYGLAEATLIVAGARAAAEQEYVSCEVSAAALERNRVVLGEADDRATRALVGCGHTAVDLRVVIVNPETHAPCAPDEVGEIWVSSPCVAAGYWEMPEASAQTFRARLADGTPETYLRTGDLGFIYKGQLVITGRLKDVIIIGGANHYPQDIELSAEHSHPDVRPGGCAAFSFDVGDEERVVVAVEIGSKPAPPAEPNGTGQGVRPEAMKAGDYVAAVRRAVAEDHDIQVYRVALLKAGSIPKTSSGKIQRQACRKLFLEGGLDLWGG
ncbi:MAG: fatty acyl-AMP ligase [Pyrinomonadaceae bacterium]